MNGTTAAREKESGSAAIALQHDDQTDKHRHVVKSSESLQLKLSSAISNILGTDGSLNLDLESLPHTGLHQVMCHNL